VDLVAGKAGIIYPCPFCFYRVLNNFSMNKSNNNRSIFKIIFILFLAAVIYFLYDMATQTTAPWNKKKQIERAF
jgi:hypothetical protein